MAVSDSDWFLVASGTTNYKVSAADMAEYVNINSPTAGGGGGSSPCPTGITQVPAITTNAKEGSVVAISTPPVSQCNQSSLHSPVQHPQLPLAFLP